MRSWQGFDIDCQLVCPWNRYARDAAFGFHTSDLRAWIEEKSAGRIAASAVQSLSIAEIRGGGPAQIGERLARLPYGSICIVNAASERDLAVAKMLMPFEPAFHS